MKPYLLLILLLCGCGNITVPTIIDFKASVKVNYTKGGSDTLIIYYRNNLGLSSDCLYSMYGDHEQIYAYGTKSFSILSQTEIKN